MVKFGILEEDNYKKKMLKTYGDFFKYEDLKQKILNEGGEEKNLNSLEYFEIIKDDENFNEDQINEQLTKYVISQIIYEIQFWMSPKTGKTRHPIAFVCDEAHLYMPRDATKLKVVEKKSLEIFEKISKEGRKYGVSLVVVSQRPAELNSTIISQCNNIISLKITNDRDKTAVATMLTDSLVGLIETLPNLDVGECIVIGDSIKLPTKIILDKPKEEPKSSTIDFWDRWIDGKGTVFDIDESIKCMIKQTR